MFWLMHPRALNMLLTDDGVKELVRLGKQQHDAAQYDAAIESFTKAIKILAPECSDSEVAPVWRWRAASYQQLGQYERAASDAERACKLDATNLDAWRTAAVCTVCIGDLPRAKFCLDTLRTFPPGGSAHVVQINAIKEGFTRKSQLMAGGWYSHLKASEVLKELRAICTTGEIVLEAASDVPLMVYRLLHLLRCHYCKVRPAAAELDVDPDHVGAELQECAARLALEARPAQLAVLAEAPGAEGLFFHDAPESLPEQRAAHEMWARLRAIQLGEAEERVAEREEPTEVDIVMGYLAARQLARFTATVLVGLALRAPTADLRQRAYKRLAFLTSHRFYQLLLGEALWDALKPQLDNPTFVSSFVSAGGLPGLAADYNQCWYSELAAGAALCALPVGAYAECSTEEAAEALELCVDKLEFQFCDPFVDIDDPSWGESRAGRRLDAEDKEICGVVLEVMRRVWAEHGIAPFARVGRLLAFGNFVHSALQIVDTRAPGVGLGLTSKPAWASMLRLWLAVERTPRGEKHQMAVMWPSQREEHLNKLHKVRRCGNLRCDGERVELDENGVAVVPVCKGCTKRRYCSGRCALEDPDHAQASCRALWKE